MRAFFVRPFGVKEGIDFDAVEAALIRPALARLRAQYSIDIDGGTTGEFTRQGNIREDMFRLLVTADLVVADVSIYNANAFYELGIRHALRHQHTFMIRAKATEANYPFDLQTDRYFTYDTADLGGGVEALATALRSTLAADANATDSPVFQLLPNLKPHERGVLMPVPRDFQEAVALAQAGSHRGDLRLLAHEAQGFEWESEGLRLVGNAQFRLKAFRGAKVTFEVLREENPGDVHANLRLGSIYQKLAETVAPAEREDWLTRSDQAIRRALDDARDPAQRAEAHALLGSNAKSRWLAEWRGIEPQQRGSAALGSPHLETALQAYLNAYSGDLDAYYPGGNALALLHIQAALAQQEPDTWEAGFDDAAKAMAGLADRSACASRIAATLSLSLGIDPVLEVTQDEGDAWAVLARADVQFLTLDKRPRRVETEYARAMARVANNAFAISAARRNIEIFEALGLLPEHVKAALGTIDKALAAAGALPAAQPRPARVVLFSGHMIDQPDRAPDRMRFPRTAEAQATARAMIEEALRAEMAAQGGVSLGIAGGACGADILFHEVCATLNIPTRLYLALPPDEFLVESVQHGGPDWVERYRLLCERVPPRVLQEDKALPRWLTDKPGYDIWQRNNLWMMFNALSLNAQHATAMALFNREREADGPGGTAHLLAITRNWGFKTIELDARKLLAA